MEHWIINNIIMIFIAFFLDLLLADPRWLPHPVVGMGKLAAYIDARLNHNHNDFKKALVSGIIALIVYLLAVSLICLIILSVTYAYNEILYIFTGSILIYFSLALKSLLKAATKILKPLSRGNIALAQKKVAEIVGRDTEHMNEEEIIRATVESVAENFIDGFFAPIFWALVGGPGAAIIYRAINTLDSMWGYKNSRYLYFGRWAARLDDVVNWLPARLGGLGLLITGGILGFNLKQSFIIWLRDAHKHPSPNSGHPEAVIAGLLGVQLGGLNYYHGQPQWRATLGDKNKKFELRDIINTQKIVFTASLLTITFIGFLGIALVLKLGVN